MRKDRTQRELPWETALLEKNMRKLKFKSLNEASNAGQLALAILAAQDSVAEVRASLEEQSLKQQLAYRRAK